MRLSFAALRVLSRPYKKLLFFEIVFTDNYLINARTNFRP